MDRPLTLLITGLAALCFAMPASSQSFQPTTKGEEMVVALGADDVVHDLLGLVRSAVSTAGVQGDEARDAAASALERLKSEHGEDMIREAGRLYSNLYSVEELDAAIAIYSSPAGRSYLSKSEDAKRLETQMTEFVLPFFGKIATEEMKKTGLYEPDPESAD